MEIVIKNFEVYDNSEERKNVGNIFDYEDSFTLDWCGLTMNFSAPELEEKIEVIEVDNDKKRKTRKLF